SALDHPNICTIHEIGETDDNQLFIAMSYYEGETLKKKIEKGPIKTEDAIEITIQIAKGLEKAHEKGIIHRDIKPANIFLTNEGIVKILDFGLAKSASRDTMTQLGSTMGTVAYMSPEQTRGSEVDHRTDIWSLGVILYEMLTGQQPFKGDYEQAVVYSIINEEPEPQTGIRNGVSMDIERIVNKCLDKNQINRYQTIENLTTALQLIPKDSKTKIHISGTSHSKIRYKSRTKTIVYFVVLFILCISIASFFIFLKNSKSDKFENSYVDQTRWKKSIAVLPFVDMSSEKDQEYFCDGISEEIINTLSHINELRVVARTSVFSFKGKNIDVREIGEKLNVEYILEGSVRKSENRLRITAQLIKATDGYHLWSNKFDRNMVDIFKIQEEISMAVMKNLKVKLLENKQSKLSRRQTENLEAYKMYLRGLHFWNKRSAEGLTKSIELFQQAIEVDPDYALAFSGLADAYSMLPYYSSYSFEEAIPKARESALKGLEIDNTLAETNTSMAYIKSMFDNEWEEGEKLFKKALEINSGYAMGHHFHGEHFRYQGRFDEALVEIQKAHELDPLSLIINRNLGRILIWNGQYDDAVNVLKKTLELDSTFPQIYENLGFAYLNLSKYNKALIEFKNEPDLDLWCAIANVKLGYRDEATKMVSEILKNRVPNQLKLARLYFVLGENDRGFSCLNKHYEENKIGLSLLQFKVFDFWKNVRSDPRFTELFKRLKD
ncbi:MAG: protein kinase, partial [Bacteroidota bacterium]